MSSAKRCEDCGTTPAPVTLTNVGTFCDRCADRYLAGAAGRPLLPTPPAPIVLVGADGRRHRLVFRLRRAPTGVVAELVETPTRGEEGYRFSVLGGHEDGVERLIEQLHAIAETEVARMYLQPTEHRPGWTVSDEDQVAGRLGALPPNFGHGVCLVRRLRGG